MLSKLVNGYRRYLLVFSASFLILAIAGIYLHEASHQYVFSLVGCESSIEFLPWPHTRADLSCWQNLSQMDRTRTIRLNNIIDIISYQLLSIYFLLSALLAAIYAYVFLYE